MSTDRDNLLSMGFDEAHVDKALKSTANAGLQPALDWLVNHIDDDDNAAGTSDIGAVENLDNLKGDPPQAKSLKCDDCGKLLPTDEAVQMHATRTGHTNFSESVEEIKPLTEEEKKIQLDKLQERLKQKKVEREDREAKEALDREKHRRKHGKEIVEAKSKFESDEIKRLTEQKRREKEEDRLYRQKLKEQIAKDREDRKAQQEKPEEDVAPKPAQPTPTLKSSSTNSNSCRIQIRHSSGPPIIETFVSTDTLFKVAFIFAQKTGCDEYTVAFRSNLAPKLYGAEEMNKTLLDLGFCPSIVLNAIKK